MKRDATRKGYHIPPTPPTPALPSPNRELPKTDAVPNATPVEAGAQQSPGAERDELGTMPSLRDAHFFRRVPADVSEATKSGGIVSLVAYVTIFWLVLTQYNEYRESRHTTELRLDRSSRTAMIGGGAAIRINFNVTMSHLPCQYASVHVADHVGAHEMGGTRNVHKVRVDKHGNQMGIYEPHKYASTASEKGDDKGMAAHVFPWHKKQHAQGDATQRKQAEMKHLSADQRHAIGQVESTIHQAGKGAHVGRRLLFADAAAYAAAAALANPGDGAPAAATQAAPAQTPPDVKADTSASCKAWANAGECLSNAGYMLTSCETACRDFARSDPSACSKWALGQPDSGRCVDAPAFMAKVCKGSCVSQQQPPPSPAPAGGAAGGGDASAGNLMVEEGGPYLPSVPYHPGASELTVPAFEKLLHDNALVIVNFYAPWCFWSNKLQPAWTAVGQRLHRRAYEQSVKFIKVDCTTKLGGELCRAQSVHAFPSVRIYRGSSHAFEPYEFGREENVIWLHLVKTAAEILVSEMSEIEDEEAKKRYSQQIAHVSKDLRDVMERRAQGLDEDWSEDALSAEDEIAEDRDLLAQISSAVASITGAKGVRPRRTGAMGNLPEDEAEQHAVTERSSDVVLGLLSARRMVPDENGAGGDENAEVWTETETHEGCNLFGYLDVSRAPGTLHVSPHSARHSFDFTAVNTTHHIDHLSFGLELTTRERRRLPAEVVRQLTTLDGYSFIATEKHETQEHHVNIMPTSFGPPGDTNPIETYQFTATSHGRTRDTLPSLLISYDVSPIHAHIVQTSEAFSDFLVSLCAIVGGAVSVFGIVDGLLYASTNAVKKSMGKNF